MSPIKIKLPKKNSVQFLFVSIATLFLILVCLVTYKTFSHLQISALTKIQEEKEEIVVQEIKDLIKTSSHDELEFEIVELIRKNFSQNGLTKVRISNDQDSIIYFADFESLSSSDGNAYAMEENKNTQDEIHSLNMNVVSDSNQLLKISLQFILSELNTKIEKAKIEIGVVALLIFLFSFFVCFWGSYLVVRPLEKMAKDAYEIATKNLSKRLKSKHNNEFGNIAFAINLLADDLDKANQQIEKLNKELKFQVRDKIGELNYEINKKRQAESLLKQSEEQFRLLFELAPIGMVISSIDGSITKVNSSFYTMLGYAEDEIVGLKIKDLTHDDDKKNDARLHENLLKGLDPHIYFEKRLVKKDGQILNVIVEAVLVKNKSGEPSHFIEQVIDITDRKRVERELIFAKEKAEESDRLKTAFLAQMSHEIRTPLNVILAAMSLIQDDLDDSDPETKTILDSVSSAGKRLQRTIDLILNISAVQSGSYIPNNTDFDLDKELRILVEEFKTMENEKGLFISYVRKTKHSTINADHYSVMQIFQNLISNAVKYTLKGKVEVILDDWDENKIQVIVKDTGIGISKDYISKMFSPFSQEDVGHKREFEGNGLGLALVKKYVEINNADILVESEKNKGSIFTVILNKKVSEVLNKGIKISDQTKNAVNV